MLWMNRSRWRSAGHGQLTPDGSVPGLGELHGLPRAGRRSAGELLTLDDEQTLYLGLSKICLEVGKPLV